MSGQSQSYLTAGWREWVRLPELGVPWLKAKLDTGARSSSIHAFDIEEFVSGGVDWVRFSVHPWQRSSADSVVAELPVHDRRTVRSSSGHTDLRYVVGIEIELVGTVVDAELTLTRRDQMGFRMLIGREALRGGAPGGPLRGRRAPGAPPRPHILVDPGRSYLGGRPPRSTRRRNRGV